MIERLSPAELNVLRRITTPNVCGAAETLGCRLRHEGLTDPAIACRLPDLGHPKSPAHTRSNVYQESEWLP